MKGLRHFIAAGIIFSSVIFNAAHAEETRVLNQPQSNVIEGLINAEKNKIRQDNLVDIINSIDSTYTLLLNNLKEGRKIVIFFDPAHGKLPDGRWQGGEATFRASCTNRPEEFYSIILSRALYGFLRQNRFIEVKSTDDFMKVLNDRSDSYDNIPFSTTVDMAKKQGAFIILSEHLNNVSMAYKASGKMNIPGIHVMNGRGGRKILTHIKNTYSGFLTLYNKLDASGFSRQYALNLKSRLTSLGMKPNSWDFGAVGDSRFSYFVDFPVSIIYESGFISNPSEEKNFRDPEFAKKVAEAQYQSLLETINEIYSIDISGHTPVMTKSDATSTELLKLSRMAVYYLKEADTVKAVEIINVMQRLYGSGGKNPQVAYFNQIKNSIVRAERFFSLGNSNAHRKRNRPARRYYRMAWRSINFNPIYSAYKEKYASTLRYKTPQEGSMGGINHIARINSPIMPVSAAKSPLNRPIILAIEKNQSIQDAVHNALAPDSDTLHALTGKLNDAVVTEKVRTRQYSSKLKRKVTVWERRKRHMKFGEGIYIISIDKNFNIVSAKSVRSVLLDPNRYQNQQYLKNSHFAMNEKNKSL